MAAYYPFIYHEYKLSFGKDTPHHFQILGIDIILDENCKPWLLEVNARPSMSINHKEELGIMDMKTGMMATTCEISKIDLYLKEPVMCDALKLAGISPAEAIEFSEFGIFSRLVI